MSARLVLDELDLNLSPLAAGLVVVVVIVVGGRTRPFRASICIAGDKGAIAIANTLVVVNRRRWVLVVVGDFAGHNAIRCGKWLRQFGQSV